MTRTAIAILIVDYCKEHELDDIAVIDTLETINNIVKDEIGLFERGY